MQDGDLHERVSAKADIFFRTPSLLSVSVYVRFDEAPMSRWSRQRRIGYGHQDVTRKPLMVVSMFVLVDHLAGIDPDAGKKCSGLPTVAKAK